MAKKEIESQSVRLRDLEAMLGEERRAREDAEERANRLEREREVTDSAYTNGDVSEPQSSIEAEDAETIIMNGSASTDLTDTATSRLQQRLDSMVSEMNEMKLQMEKYRERAETAEADRKSLAEMIEHIRADNAKKAAKEARRRSRSNSERAREVANDGSSDPLDEQEAQADDTADSEPNAEDDAARALLQKATHNGRPAECDDGIEFIKTSHALATRPNPSDLALHGAPAVSILTVVALGVAVMAWLNNYPKVVDR